MLGPGEITITRHVAVWYYLLTGVTAVSAVWWLARRRLLSLGVRLLAAGIAVNALWEGILFTVWERQYETVVPTVVQAIYQSLTEFGPPLVIGVLLIDWAGGIDLSSWRGPTDTTVHRLFRQGAALTLGVLLALGLFAAVGIPVELHTPITVTREITWLYFAGAAGLALVVLSIAVVRHNRTALLLFVALGVFNVLFELVGLVGGYRSYQGLSPLASLFIGMTESGTAAALVWLLIESTAPKPVTQALTP